MDFIIRPVLTKDLDRVAEIEGLCFPAAEAAARSTLEQRIKLCGDYFLVAEVNGAVIGFINGALTEQAVICDDMYGLNNLNNNGNNVAVFGLDVVSDYRQQGIAAKLLAQFVAIAKRQHKKQVVLTCKEQLVAYYEKFGFKNQGLSGSVHGGASWFDLSLDLTNKTAD